MTMKTTEDIRRMVERFFEGETTLDEEQALYDYFASDDVATTLLPYKEMFRDFSHIPFETALTENNDKAFAEQDPQPTSLSDKTDKPESFLILKQLLHHWHWAAAAAIITAVCFAGSAFYRSYQERQYLNLYAGSYVIVNGKRTDDLRRIHRHIEQTIAQAELDEQQFAPNTFIDEAVEDILSDITDDSERETILKMLNE